MSAPCHRHRRLTVSTARDGDRVLIEIGDNSPGGPLETAPVACQARSSACQARTVRARRDSSATPTPSAQR
jgi:hypothetical protein